MSDERLLARIGDVAALLRGVTYEKQASSDTPKGGLVPLLRATNINGEIDFGGLVYVPALCVSEFQYLRPGDSVIAASSGSLAVVGKSATLRTEWNGTFGAFCYVLRPDSVRIAPFYLSYFLQTSEYRAQVSRLAAGVNINNLKRQHLEDLRIPVCPLPEQHRIVCAIESYFTRLDDAVATLKRVQRNLKRYRASVLKAAVEGRLVPTEAELARAEGRSYEPASVLLTRILAERRRRWEEAELAKMTTKGQAPRDDKWKAKYVVPVAPDTSELPELPEGWCWTTLDSFLVSIEAGKNFKCDERPPVGDEVGVVKVSAVTWGSFDELESKTCRRGDQLREEHLIRPGDLLISRANTIEFVGACVIVDGVRRRLMLSDKILRLKLVGLWASWLLWTLRSRWGRHEIERLATGNQESMRNISQVSIRRIRVPLPPANEGKRIIEAVHAGIEMADHLAASTQANMTRFTRLRQSILKWAFEGRLVDQDPTDEPASVLLERIRAERKSTGDKTARSPRRARIRTNSRA